MAFDQVWVHESAGLEHWGKLRLDSLLTGQVQHGFHYQSLQQSKLWLEVFRNHSPAAKSEAVTSIYQQLAEAVAAQFSSQSVHVISLGCGDGRKDLLLLAALCRVGAKVRWSPQDISLALVLHTIKLGAKLPLLSVHPMVADLQALPSWGQAFTSIDPAIPRIFTYFGLTPNFDPEFLVSSWKELLRPMDHLLTSANLAPVRDEAKSSYLAATERIQPQYDNPETQRWLTSILQDWGIAEYLTNYRIRLESRHDLLRLVAVMEWNTTRELSWEGQTISVTAGENLRLFFSYRYSPGRFQNLAAQASLKPLGEWIAESREEGVWWLVPAPLPL